MDIAVQRVVKQGKRLLLIQLLLTVVVAVGMAVYNADRQMAWGAIYGGSISMLSSLLLGLGVGWAASGEGGARQWFLYVSAAFRFLLILICFAIGLGLIGLPPTSVLVGFVVAQLVYPLAAKRERESAPPEAKE